MTLFNLYMGKVIDSMKKEKDSIYNACRLRFIGRHILSSFFVRFLHIHEIGSPKIWLAEWRKWRSLRVTTPL